MILLGELSLWVGLLMAIWSATVSFAGGQMRRTDLVASGERATYAAFAFVLLASTGLWSALLASDFSLRYVASHTTANLPAIYKFSAFWGGQQGTMLFMCLMLAFCSAVALLANRHRNRELLPYVTGTLALVQVFFLATTVFGANPYQRLDWIPPDGTGLNPQLQNPGMAIHPPNLYLGYVATAVPFAFAVGALVTRRLDAEWLRAVRRWALVSWLFLTIGITLGMWWAYAELGWGDYWTWDPAENASLLPWLTGTAFLHSIMIQERRGMLRTWNVTLVVATFLLSILGTFITRSGVIEGVHSFAQSPVGNGWAGFLLVALVATAFLVATRLEDLGARAELGSVVSREAAFLYNNVLLLGIAFSVLWGTIFPIISEAVRGSKITVGPPFFNAVTIPLGLLLLGLTGVGSLIAWRRASVANLKRQCVAPVTGGVALGVTLFAVGMRDGYALVSYTLAGLVATAIGQELVTGVNARRRMHGEAMPIAVARLVARNRRRYGGYVVHLGVVVLFAAFAGLVFRKEYGISLAPGATFTAVDPYNRTWTFASQGVSRYDELNRHVTAVVLEATRAGAPPALIKSEKRQHVDSRGTPTFEPSTEAGILASVRQDVYLVLDGVTGEETAEIRIMFNPLVWWVWSGGIIMAIGGLIVMWPRATRSGAATRVDRGYVVVMEASARDPAGGGP